MKLMILAALAALLAGCLGDLFGSNVRAVSPNDPDCVWHCGPTAPSVCCTVNNSSCCP